MYNKLINKSWKDLFDNLQILVPDLLFVIVTFILGLITFYMTGVSNELMFLFKALNSGQTQTIPFTLIDLGSVLADNLARIILSIAFFVFTTFFIGAGFEAVRYGMFRDLLNKKKLNFLGNFTKLNKEFYWRLIGTKILVFLVFFIAVICAVAVFGLLSIVSTVLGVVAGVLLLIGLFIYFWLMLFFVMPVVFFEKKKLTESLKFSFKYSKKHLSHVVVTLLILIGVMILFSIVINIVLMPFKEFIIVNIVLSSLLYLIPSVWGKYFVFVSYKEVK